MQTLQGKADVLKSEQIRLKQVINEKNTASILVGLFATSGSAKGISAGDEKEDPRIEELLRRATSDIPDSTNVTELPSLILPGQHASKKMRASSVAEDSDGYLEDGIDYGLLGKDRSKCSAEELDQIRRERNRMHAKRTRDRKRMFMEELGEICRKLEEENEILRVHLRKIDPDYIDVDRVVAHDDDDLSSVDDPSDDREAPSAVWVEKTRPSSQTPELRRSAVDQIRTLLAAATSCERRPEGKRTIATVSSDDSNDESIAEADPSIRLLAKRRRHATQALSRASLVPTA
jgi:Basic region leucine zipper